MHSPLNKLSTDSEINSPFIEIWIVGGLMEKGYMRGRGVYLKLKVILSCAAAVLDFL